jgi:hypothetical protein
MKNQNRVVEISTPARNKWWKSLCRILRNIPFIIMNFVIQIKIIPISSYHVHKGSIGCDPQFETDQI